VSLLCCCLICSVFELQLLRGRRNWQSTKTCSSIFLQFWWLPVGLHVWVSAVVTRTERVLHWFLHYRWFTASVFLLYNVPVLRILPMLFSIECPSIWRNMGIVCTGMYCTGRLFRYFVPLKANRWGGCVELFHSDWKYH